MENLTVFHLYRNIPAPNFCVVIVAKHYLLQKKFSQMEVQGV
jgi:hypothetical protein